MGFYKPMNSSKKRPSRRTNGELSVNTFKMNKEAVTRLLSLPFAPPTSSAQPFIPTIASASSRAGSFPKRIWNGFGPCRAFPRRSNGLGEMSTVSSHKSQFMQIMPRPFPLLASLTLRWWDGPVAWSSTPRSVANNGSARARLAYLGFRSDAGSVRRPDGDISPIEAKEH